MSKEYKKLDLCSLIDNIENVRLVQEVIINGHSLLMLVGKERGKPKGFIVKQHQKTVDLISLHKYSTKEELENAYFEEAATESVRSGKDVVFV